MKQSDLSGQSVDSVHDVNVLFSTQVSPEFFSNGYFQSEYVCSYQHVYSANLITYTFQVGFFLYDFCVDAHLIHGNSNTQIGLFLASLLYFSAGYRFHC